MRSIQYLASLAAFALVFSLGAFARDTNSGSFDIGQNAKIGRTLLKPGHYKAEWTGPTNALNVTIIDRGKTVATTKGHLKELPTKSPYDAVEFRSDKSQRVDEIDFNNRTEALVLAGS
jgi:hypothetical protein